MLDQKVNGLEKNNKKRNRNPLTESIFKTQSFLSFFFLQFVQILRVSLLVSKARSPIRGINAAVGIFLWDHSQKVLQ